MNIIIDSNEVDHTEIMDILNCRKQFYETLYDKIPVTENILLSDMLGDNVD